MPYHFPPAPSSSAIQGQISGGLDNLLAPLNAQNRAAIELSKAHAQRLRDETANDAQRTGIMGRQADATISQALAAAGLSTAQADQVKFHLAALKDVPNSVGSAFPGAPPEALAGLGRMLQAGFDPVKVAEARGISNRQGVFNNPTSTYQDKVNAAGASGNYGPMEDQGKVQFGTPGATPYGRDPNTGAPVPLTGDGGNGGLLPRQLTALQARLTPNQADLASSQARLSSLQSMQRMVDSGAVSVSPGLSLPGALTTSNWVGDNAPNNRTFDDLASRTTGGTSLTGTKLSVLLEKLAEANKVSRANDPSALGASLVTRSGVEQHKLDMANMGAQLMATGVPIQNIIALQDKYMSSPDAYSSGTYYAKSVKAGDVNAKGAEYSAPVPFDTWFAQHKNADPSLAALMSRSPIKSGLTTNQELPVPMDSGAAPFNPSDLGLVKGAPAPSGGSQPSQKALAKYPQDLLNRAATALTDPEATPKERAKAQSILNGE